MSAVADRVAARSELLDDLLASTKLKRLTHQIAESLATAGHGAVDVTVAARFADGTQREETGHADDEEGD